MSVKINTSITINGNEFKFTHDEGEELYELLKKIYETQPSTPGLVYPPNVRSFGADETKNYQPFYVTSNSQGE